MSVALVIRSGSKPGEDYVPIATEKTFEECWRPGCAALQLKWVPLFQSGLPLRKEDIPDIIGDLSRLKTWMIASMKPLEADHSISRIDNLILALKTLEAAAVFDAFIG